MAQMASGWYPDPNDEKAEIYWDGERWHGKREKLQSAAGKQRKSDSADSVAESIRQLPTRKFWITTLVVIAFVLVLIFYIIPENNKSNEQKAKYDREMNSECMKEYMGAPDFMDYSDAHFKCMVEGRLPD